MGAHYKLGGIRMRELLLDFHDPELLGSRLRCHLFGPIK